ncbi:hypothetical protein KEX41_28805 (plasmid) [Burkholderia thailandensis]|uniref:hypothetical protein n=1 Tax=Burkholderia thailandensis TaxID=57975 RepID=UPI00192D3D75|nr:hypothetical protein [Burkholderia thailandensis]MBS2132187.1 hypothetical protein [Burkholderia thailandensis]QRA15284.1 hypothetical protein JMY07_29230 [Burkholderia thailandensis]
MTQIKTVLVLPHRHINTDHRLHTDPRPVSIALADVVHGAPVVSEAAGWRLHLSFQESKVNEKSLGDPECRSAKKKHSFPSLCTSIEMSWRYVTGIDADDRLRPTRLDTASVLHA